jgi:hypothetical protein
MNRNEFERLAVRSRELQAAGELTDYWKGFLRGLRRGFHGENFGTETEHLNWMSCAKKDKSRLPLQEGYRAGFGVGKLDYTEGIELITPAKLGPQEFNQPHILDRSLIGVLRGRKP